MHHRMLLSVAIIVVVSSPACSSIAQAAGESIPSGTLVESVTWSTVNSEELPAGGTIVHDDEHGEVLQLKRGSDVLQQNHVVSISDPRLAKKAYMLRGFVRYEDVGEAGFLEMWNHFLEPKQGSYFSRTMAPAGPMGVIQGRSPWREFVLPFTSDDSFSNPHKLDVNLVLPGDGTVWLSDLRLEEMEPMAIVAAGKPGNLSGLGLIPKRGTLLALKNSEFSR